MYTYNLHKFVSLQNDTEIKPTKELAQYFHSARSVVSRRSHTYNNKRAAKKETKKQRSADRTVDQRSTSLLDESCHHTYLNNSLER